MLFKCFKCLKNKFFLSEIEHLFPNLNKDKSICWSYFTELYTSRKKYMAQICFTKTNVVYGSLCVLNIMKHKHLSLNDKEVKFMLDVK